MQAKLNVAQKAVSLAQANWLPNLLLIGNYNYKRPNRENEPQFYRSWDITLAVQMNIWDWGQVRHQVAQARSWAQQGERVVVVGKEMLRDGVPVRVAE